MKVKELIELLQKEDPEDTISINYFIESKLDRAYVLELWSGTVDDLDYKKRVYLE